MYRPVLTVPPTSTPVSAGEAKLHCRIDEDAENSLVTALIHAAVSHLDGWSGVLGRCLVTQTWRQDFDDFAPCLRLPLTPVSTIFGVTYLDAAGDEQTVAAANYGLLEDERGLFVRFVESFGAPSLRDDRPAVSVTFVAGYGEPADVPPAIKQAMLLLIGHWFENRSAVNIGSMTSVPMAADALLAPFRRVC